MWVVRADKTNYNVQYNVPPISSALNVLYVNCFPAVKRTKTFIYLIIQICIIMRRLLWNFSLTQLQSAKAVLVPALFTEHQFHLLKKKLSHQELTPSERSEFSRSISPKMNAIYTLLEKETDSVFMYGKEKIKSKRVPLAIKYLKKFSRQFKNKHVLITGSFLYKDHYNDIDVFVISKYDKDDYVQGKFHINYLPEKAYTSLFFASIRQVCISNQKIIYQKITESVNADTFTSLYQELFNDLDRHFPGVRKTLREFLLQAAFLSQYPLPDSVELHLRTERILHAAKTKEVIKNIFVQSMVLSAETNKTIFSLRKIISSYKELMKEYKQHKNYYKDLITAFQEVIAIAR